MIYTRNTRPLLIPSLLFWQQYTTNNLGKEVWTSTICSNRGVSLPRTKSKVILLMSETTRITTLCKQWITSSYTGSSLSLSKTGVQTRQKNGVGLQKMITTGPAIFTIMVQKPNITILPQFKNSPIARRQLALRRALSSKPRKPQRLRSQKQTSCP